MHALVGIHEASEAHMNKRLSAISGREVQMHARLNASETRQADAARLLLEAEAALGAARATEAEARNLARVEAAKRAEVEKRAKLAISREKLLKVELSEAKARASRQQKKKSAQLKGNGPWNQRSGGQRSGGGGGGGVKMHGRVNRKNVNAFGNGGQDSKHGSDPHGSGFPKQSQGQTARKGKHQQGKHQQGKHQQGKHQQGKHQQGKHQQGNKWSKARAIYKGRY